MCAGPPGALLLAAALTLDRAEWAGGVLWSPCTPQALSSQGPAPNAPPATTGTQPARMRVRARTLLLSLSFSHTHFLFLLFAVNCLLEDAGGCASGKAQLAPL